LGGDTNLFEHAGNVGHVINRRKSSILDFEMAEKCLIQSLKMMRNGTYWIVKQDPVFSRQSIENVGQEASMAIE
jgi:hypothetical protein